VHYVPEKESIKYKKTDERDKLWGDTGNWRR
jgi:hypothetical protein